MVFLHITLLLAEVKALCAVDPRWRVGRGEGALRCRPSFGGCGGEGVLLFSFMFYWSSFLLLLCLVLKANADNHVVFKTTMKTLPRTFMIRLNLSRQRPPIMSPLQHRCFYSQTISEVLGKL